MERSLCAALGALLLLLPGAAASQEAKQETSEPWTPPRMAWGVPDLQGTWTNATLTTLERPEELESLVLTPEEADRILQQTEEFIRRVDEVPEGELPQGQGVGGYNTFWMDPGDRLAVVNGEIRSSLIVDPEDGELPYNLRGRFNLVRSFLRFNDTDNPEVRFLGERCIVGFGSTGGPPMLPVLYNNHYQIVQSPGFVMILVEMNHDARIIRIGGERLPSKVRRWFGDSVGHWEGDTLVVETTHFHPGQSFRAAIRHQVYMTEDARVTERFTRLGPDEILYEFTVDDPGAYRRPWRGEIPFLKAEGRIYEYACHEGNYALPGILAGARAEEQED